MKTSNTINYPFILILLIIILSADFGFYLKAQSTDKEKRISQKADILSDILQKLLFNQNQKGFNYVLYGNKLVESRITENGILFIVNQNQRLEDIEVNTIRSVDVNKDGNGAGTITVDVKGKEFDRNAGGLTNKKLEDFKPALTEFLADYAMLLTDLDDTDKVNILLKSQSSPFIFKVQESNVVNGIRNEFIQKNSELQDQFSASIQMSDVRSLMQRKINRDEFSQLINFEIVKPEKTPLDIEIFTNVLDGLYTIRNTKNYFATDELSYTNLASLGYLFKFQLYSSYRRDNQFEIVAKGESKLFNQEEKDRFVLDEYSSFKDQFITYLLDYGITLKSLNENRTVQFEITLPNCKTFEDDMPDLLRIQFPVSLWNEYRQKSVNLSEAKKQIKIEEIEIKY